VTAATAREISTMATRRRRFSLDMRQRTVSPALTFAKALSESFEYEYFKFFSLSEDFARECVLRAIRQSQFAKAFLAVNFSLVGVKKDLTALSTDKSDCEAGEEGALLSSRGRADSL